LARIREAADVNPENVADQKQKLQMIKVKDIRIAIIVALVFSLLSIGAVVYLARAYDRILDV
jgi:hypothetical protein